MKLCAIGLSCLQKLTAHDAVPATSLPQILITLEQVGPTPLLFPDVECHLVVISCKPAGVIIIVITETICICMFRRQEQILAL